MKVLVHVFLELLNHVMIINAPVVDYGRVLGVKPGHYLQGVIQALLLVDSAATCATTESGNHIDHSAVEHRVIIVVRVV